MSQEFFSALGGAISLFLGVSFIMIMEVLELFWDFIMNILRNENCPHFNMMDMKIAPINNHYLSISINLKKDYDLINTDQSKDETKIL